MPQPATKSNSAKAMLKALKNPFDIRFVKYRIGAQTKAKDKAIALFYLDAREVRKRLDEVCGIDGWSTKLIPAQGGMLCELSIRMPDGTWITKTDGGEPSHTSPFKGSCSDAIKRAAVNFGVGAYLYYIPNQWYPAKNGRFLKQPTLPSWAIPQEGIEDWEKVAISEYDQSKDIDLDNYSDIEYSDEESQGILEQSKSRREEIINALKGKLND